MSRFVDVDEFLKSRTGQEQQAFAHGTSYVGGMLRAAADKRPRLTLSKVVIVIEGEIGRLHASVKERREGGRQAANVWPITAENFEEQHDGLAEALSLISDDQLRRLVDATRRKMNDRDRARIARAKATARAARRS